MALVLPILRIVFLRALQIAEKSGREALQPLLLNFFTFSLWFNERQRHYKHLRSQRQFCYNNASFSSLRLTIGLQYNGKLQSEYFFIEVSKKFLVRRSKWRQLRMKNDGFVMATTVTVLMMVLAAFQGFVTSWETSRDTVRQISWRIDIMWYCSCGYHLLLDSKRLLRCQSY